MPNYILILSLFAGDLDSQHLKVMRHNERQAIAFHRSSRSTEFGGDRQQSHGRSSDRRIHERKHHRRGHDRSPHRLRRYDDRRINGRRRRTPERPKKNRCIGVFDLSKCTTLSQIIDIFSMYGKIEKAYLMYDAKSRCSRGFGFIYFENLEDAVSAKYNSSGLSIDGRTVRVDFSATQRPHSPTPGMYKGRRVRSY